MLTNLRQFLHYWYFRYLMVTELYMVEKWERAAANVFFILFLSILSYFNYTVVLGIASKLLKFLTYSMQSGALDALNVPYDNMFTDPMVNDNKIEF